MFDEIIKYNYFNLGLKPKTYLYPKNKKFKPRRKALPS